MTKKILLVRLSALGDIIHLFPAISDIRRRYPAATLDLAVDERFAGVARLHAGVNRVISLPLKRLKRKGFSTSALSEACEVVRALRRGRYDVVLDLHGVWKSAIVSRVARARDRIGLVPEACAEKPAAWFYSKRYLPTGPSVVERMRHFAALALDSDPSGAVDYGLKPVRTVAAAPVAVFVHSASKSDKLWPESHWIALGAALAARGFRICLPWSQLMEFERSKRLYAAIGKDACELPPFRPLEQWVEAFASVALVVGVDTGLTHLAAANGTPCLALFTRTNPGLFVPSDPKRAAALGDEHRLPTPDEALAAVGRLLSDYRAPHASAAADLAVRTEADPPPLQVVPTIPDFSQVMRVG